MQYPLILMTRRMDSHRLHWQMGTVETKNYLSYLASVLGGKEYLSSADVKNSNIELEDSNLGASLIFIVDFDPGASRPESELFYKILKAMGLKPDRYQILNIQEDDRSDLRKRLGEYSCKVIVSMVPHLGLELSQNLETSEATVGEWFDCDGKRLMFVESPRELLKSPQKKRLAWDALKVVMKELE